MRKKLRALCLVVLFAFVLVSCDNKAANTKTNTETNEDSTDPNTETNEDSTEIDILYSYIEENYGFCDSDIHGIYMSSASHQGNTGSLDKEVIQFDDGTNDGAVFYKLIKNQIETIEMVCVYLSNESGEAYLKADYIKLSGTNGNLNNSINHTITLAKPHMKNRYYCMADQDNLTIVELSEINEGFYDRHYYLSRESDTGIKYEECVTVYSYNDGLTEAAKIKREIAPGNSSNTKVCTINFGENIWAYASGFSSYTHESAIMLETEQEFCDQANQLLDKDWIAVAETSWENRWYGLEIDESSIPDDMVKVDLNCSYGEADGEGNVQSDIEILVNTDKVEQSQ